MKNKNIVFLITLISALFGYVLGYFSSNSGSVGLQNDSAESPAIGELVPVYLFSQLIDRANSSPAFDHYLKSQMQIESNEKFSEFFIYKDLIAENEQYYLVRPGSGIVLVQDILIGSLTLQELAILDQIYVSINIIEDHGFTAAKINEAVRSGQYDIGVSSNYSVDVVSGLTKKEFKELMSRLPSVRF